MLLRITKEFTFEMAHALHGYDGKCTNIHGHSYHLAVTVTGTPITDKTSPKQGMVIDFTDLKNIVNKVILEVFDHALVLNEATAITINSPATLKIVHTEYQPTSENLLIDFVSRISKHIHPPLKLHSLKLRETDSSYAEWFATDNPSV